MTGIARMTPITNAIFSWIDEPVPEPQGDDLGAGQLLDQEVADLLRDEKPTWRPDGERR